VPLLPGKARFWTGWQDEGTLLRAYLSDDGACMLADPILGGAVAKAKLATRNGR